MESVTRPILDPSLGHFNPHVGNGQRYGGWMARAPKIVSHQARMARELVGERVRGAVRLRYPEGAISAAYRKIEAATGISLSTLQRIVDAETGATLDTLADLAHHLGTTIQAFTAVQDGSQAISQSPRPLQRRRTSSPRQGAAG